MDIPHKPPRQNPDVEGAITRWSDAVWRLCLARLHNRQDAEDAFQNTFLALVRANPVFSSPEHEKAWLLTCACNCATDVFRKAKAHPEASFDEAFHSAATPQTGGYEANLLRDEELTRALSYLSDAQRTVVHLHYYEGYSIREISDITGFKPSTVRSHLHRARNILKQQLEETPSCNTMISSAATLTCKKA